MFMLNQTLTSIQYLVNDFFITYNILLVLVFVSMAITILLQKLSKRDTDRLFLKIKKLEEIITVLQNDIERLDSRSMLTLNETVNCMDNLKEYIQQTRYVENAMVKSGEYNWSILSKQKLPINFIIQYQEQIDWTVLTQQYGILTDEFIRIFKKKLDWGWVSTKKRLSENFIRKYKDYVDWVGISMSQYLSEDFIREFQDMVSWREITIYQPLSEDFIREFVDKLNWNRVMRRMKYGPVSTRKGYGYKYKGYSHGVLEHQKISEELIGDFRDIVNWEYISWNRELSEGFIRKFHDRISWAGVINVSNVSQELKDEFGYSETDIDESK